MTDNKKDRRPQDSQKINISEDYEIRYWTKALNITRDELISVVNRVGVMVEDVKRALGNNRKTA